MLGIIVPGHSHRHAEAASSNAAAPEAAADELKVRMQPVWLLKFCRHIARVQEEGVGCAGRGAKAPAHTQVGQGATPPGGQVMGPPCPAGVFHCTLLYILYIYAAMRRKLGPLLLITIALQYDMSIPAVQ